MTPLLQAEGITKAFRHGVWPHRRSITVLEGANLTLERGELVGLVGENGSGKSTLMKIIVGLIARDSGTLVRIGRMGYCPQQPLVWEKLTVQEHFELFARAYGMTQPERVRASGQLLEELDFVRYARFRIEDLSGGTRQKLNLALALMHHPDLLLLDEPYAGFDWETYLRFWEMAEVRRSGGMGILIVSHLLSERDRLSRIVTLRDGRTTSEEAGGAAGRAAVHA